jgi:hypothetical protein
MFTIAGVMDVTTVLFFSPIFRYLMDAIGKQFFLALTPK